MRFTFALLCLVSVGHSAVADPAAPRALAAGTKAGQEWDGDSLKMTFCWCPEGSFLRGSPKGERLRSDEEDQVGVTLTGFWLGKHEVTQSEWNSVMGKTQRDQAGNESLAGEGARYPVYSVSHDEATEFVTNYTRQERAAGRLPGDWEYRLPTDVQSEYGCRAGTKTATAVGDKLDSRAVHFDGNGPYPEGEAGPYLKRTTEVGRYAANPWGLCDMHGNVWEWCRDWYELTPPGGKDPEVSKETTERVVRGGCWLDVGKFCRSAARTGYFPDEQKAYVGFRVAVVRVGP